MMPSPASIRRRSGFGRTSHHAFTLIELLAVMVIILILAGLILNIAGNAQYKSAFARATAEIKQMENACESYKIDNGTYPRDNATNGYTDKLNAQGTGGTPPDPSTYINASKYLFQQLGGYSNVSGSTTTSTSKVYITFLPSQLLNSDGSSVSAGVSTTTYLVDPFGLSYGYSTANQLAQDQNNATANSANPAASAAGYNPTFDLWSTGGYASAGKAYPTSVTASQYNTLWAKNW